MQVCRRSDDLECAEVFHRPKEKQRLFAKYTHNELFDKYTGLSDGLLECSQDTCTQLKRNSIVT